MAKRLLVLTLSIGATALGACGGPATPSRTAGSTPAEGWLAWSADERGAARTTWLDPEGQPIGEREGIVIAAGEELIEVVPEVESVVLPTCEDVEAGRPPSGGGETGIRTRLVAVSLGSGARRTLVEPLEVPGAASLRHVIVPVASLGPYLFARESAEVFACGAHGNVDVAMRVIDLRTGLPAELAVPVEQELVERARPVLAEEIEGAVEEVDPVHRVATYPVIEDGHVELEHVLTTEVCYACGDGEWSSYTRATELRDPRVPPLLAQHAILPAPIARWLATQRDVQGVSSASNGQLTAFR